MIRKMSSRHVYRSLHQYLDDKFYNFFRDVDMNEPWSDTLIHIDDLIANSRVNQKVFLKRVW